MKKENDSKNKSNKIKIPIILTISALVLAAGFFMARNLVAENDYRQVVRTINAEYNEAMGLTLNELETRKRIDANSIELDKLETDYRTAASLINENQRLVSQFYSTLYRVCDNHFNHTLSRDLPTGMRLRLLPAEKRNNIDQLREAMHAIELDQERHCSELKGFEELEKLNLQFRESYLAIGEIFNENWEREDLMEDLSKYADGSFQVVAMDEIIRATSPRYEAYIDANVEALAAFYDAWSAAVAGDLELSDRKFEEYTEVANISLDIYQRANEEYIGKRQNIETKALENTIEYLAALQRLSENITNSQIHIAYHELEVLMLASVLYSYYNDEKYPSVSSSEDLVEKLKESRFIDTVEMEFEYVGYLLEDGATAVFTLDDTKGETRQVELVGAPDLE